MSQVPLRVSPIITPKDLAEKMSSSANIRIVDGTWHMSITGFSGKKNPQSEYYRDHIPGALFFDLDACSDKESPYSNMLPSAEQFADHVSKLGIGNNTHVIVYDNNAAFGLFSASRVWWMFRVFGHNLVSVLDGGLPRWIKEGYYTTDDVDRPPPRTFLPRLNHQLIKTYEDVDANLSAGHFQVVDARPTSRYDGTGSEPTPGVKPGHIPNAVNIPFSSFLDAKEKRLKTKQEVQEVFQEAGVALDRPIVAMCGKGMVCGLVALVAFICDKKDVGLYDGSWVEWFQRAPTEKKEAVPK